MSEIFVFSIKGLIEVDINGRLLLEAVDTVVESEVRDATLALDDFISYSEKNYSFSGRVKETKNDIDVSDWVRYSEEGGGNILTIQLTDVRRITPIQTDTTDLVEAGSGFAEAVHSNTNFRVFMKIK